ncbi:MAG: hypothetical protein ACR2PO_13590 [Methyloligellaceae bacterium]
MVDATGRAGRAIATRCRVPVLALLAGAALLLASLPAARAFCVVNATEERLLFAAWLHDRVDQEIVLRKWVEAGARACAKPDTGTGIVDVFVFSDEDAIEGCDDEIPASGTLTLKAFEEFDRCAWSK